MAQPRDEHSAPIFQESLVITDDPNWIWQFASGVLSRLEMPHLRIPSTMELEKNWKRFKDAPFLLVHWESTTRKGGAVIEDILQAAPGLGTLDRIIVLSESPSHEDVVYWSELGLHRILRLRLREKDLVQASTELERHLTFEAGLSPIEYAWRELQKDLEAMDSSPSPEALEKAHKTFSALEPDEPTARSLDTEALLSSLAGEDDKACALWEAALEKNPNFYQAYHHLIAHHRRCHRPHKAYALLSKLCEFNRSNMSRLVMMGDIQVDLQDFEKAEFHFKAALERDPSCSRALNGLAAVRFAQDRLDESRELLSRSHLAFKAAAHLNSQGIKLVRAKKYEEALRHYEKAQYVLPIQDKSPLLFFNMGLCYSRWGKPQEAREFLKIALIKDPNYNKAKELMSILDKRVDHGQLP